MTDGEEKRARKRLRDDFPLYARECLRIRAKAAAGKAGAIKPLTLNRVQRHLHERIERQLKRTGKVRAIILKGRQQGCSTYVEARYYWKVTHSFGSRAFILTHEQAATDNLFGMVELFHAHCPDPVKPSTSAANAKELHFDRLESGYRVGTASTRATGRSSTIQFFHGSEVAFWLNGEEHMAGIMQAIPDAPGTESILESTAAGMGNLFHQLWQQAETGEGDYEAIFIPWFWQEEYIKDVPEDFALTPEENEYRDLYDLDAEQMAWRRAKITELRDEMLFHQEYPATAAEAFETSGEDVLIPPTLVMRARKAEVEPYGPLVVGIDPARFGNDRSSIIRRRTRHAFGLESYLKIDTMELAGIVAGIIDEEEPVKVFIDVNGLGAGTYDRLRERGYGRVIVAVNGGEKATNPNRYVNKRCEMWGEMRDWFEGDAPVQIPDTDTLHADLTGPKYAYDSNTRLKLEKKEDMKKRGLLSPDEGDALAMTFALPVHDPKRDQREDRYARAARRQRQKASAWAA